MSFNELRALERRIQSGDSSVIPRHISCYKRIYNLKTYDPEMPAICLLGEDPLRLDIHGNRFSGAFFFDRKRSPSVVLTVGYCGIKENDGSHCQTYTFARDAVKINLHTDLFYAPQAGEKFAGLMSGYSAHMLEDYRPGDKYIIAIRNQATLLPGETIEFVSADRHQTATVSSIEDSSGEWVVTPPSSSSSLSFNPQPIIASLKKHIDQVIAMFLDSYVVIDPDDSEIGANYIFTLKTLEHFKSNEKVVLAEIKYDQYFVYFKPHELGKMNARGFLGA